MQTSFPHSRTSPGSASPPSSMPPPSSSLPSSSTPSRRSPAFKSSENGHTRRIEIYGWSISTVKKPILNAQEIEEAQQRIGIPLPEITFGNNLVELCRHPGIKPDAHPTSEPASSISTTTTTDPSHHALSSAGTARIAFETIEALARIDATGEHNIKVAYADKWAKSRNLQQDGAAGGEGLCQSSRSPAGGEPSPSVNVIETVKNYDWTYSTTYSGQSSSDLPFIEVSSTEHPGIPLAKLARQDEPILFYDDVTLFEDELHDNGVANLSVKIRVMPSCFFLLSRFFLRVDHVMFRLFDVRVYHDFSTNEVVKETRGKEATYESVKSRLPGERPDDLTPLTDSNWVANVLGMLEIQKASPSGRPETVAPSPSPSSSFSSSPPVLTSSTAAPWATAAGYTSGRRQVAPGVSVPLRSPVLPPQPPPPPMKAQQAITHAQQQQGPGAQINQGGDQSKPQLKTKWPGLGVKLYRAVLRAE